MLIERDSAAKLVRDLLAHQPPPQGDVIGRAALRANLIGDIQSTVRTGSFKTVRAAEGVWSLLSPGVEMKLLHIEPSGNKSYLLRLQAGGKLPGHYHTGDEECLVLAGEVNLGSVIARAGDYHFAPRGTAHGVIGSLEGALLFLRSAKLSLPFNHEYSSTTRAARVTESAVPD